MASLEHDPDADAYDPVGIEVRSVIFPQDFLPDRSSEWARLHFAAGAQREDLSWSWAA